MTERAKIAHHPVYHSAKLAQPHSLARTVATQSVEAHDAVIKACPIPVLHVDSLDPEVRTWVW